VSYAAVTRNSSSRRGSAAHKTGGSVPVVAERGGGEIINDELCGGYGPDCNSSAVLDWLRSLGEKDREELVFQADADWSEKQGI